MSKYQQSETNMSDPACLVVALNQMGFKEVESHAEPQTLYDYCGHARPEKAQVIIRRKHTGLGLSNDVGFFKGADGKYAAVISEYDAGSKFNASWMGKLKQNYAEIRVVAQARAKGYRCLCREVVNNKIKLRFAAR